MFSPIKYCDTRHRGRCHEVAEGVDGRFGDGSHAYSRKYSRFARLRLLGFKTPYFRNLPSKNNTQLFFSVAYRLRLAQARKRA
jgi:hypothetical protein